MKHLKLFESFEEEDIHTMCEKYGIENYTINEDGSIDVDGNVNFLSSSRLKKLPLKFNNVTGYFSCSYNKLTSLEDCPKSVGDDFDCSDNKLTSLEGCPESVGGDFNCGSNKLTSLEGCPGSVGGYFSCQDNKLTSLEGCPESVGDFWCYFNKLTSLEGCPKVVGGDFDCESNKIISFEHLPFSIGGRFVCRENPINEIWELFKDYSKIEFLNDCDAIREPDAVYKKPIIILDRLNYFLEEIGKPTVVEVKGYKCI
jgi:hypothetical protein